MYETNAEAKTDAGTEANYVNIMLNLFDCSRILKCLGQLGGGGGGAYCQQGQTDLPNEFEFSLESEGVGLLLGSMSPPTNIVFSGPSFLHHNAPMATQNKYS